jgi:hypothetical protein
MGGGNNGQQQQVSQTQQQAPQVRHRAELHLYRYIDLVSFRRVLTPLNLLSHTHTQIQPQQKQKQKKQQNNAEEAVAAAAAAEDPHDAYYRQYYDYLTNYGNDATDSAYQKWRPSSEVASRYAKLGYPCAGNQPPVSG